ncbi:MAG: acyltransferase [Hyphomicrobiaceae bacterium]|nr:acyltransferase [Hyphomicrobiaceae bacterium]
MARDRANYLPHVDGLRAIAILLVVVYHAWPSVLSGGFVGVDVFFVISGFLITRLMLAEMQAGTFSILAFFARRIRRLLPAAAVMIATVLAAGWLILLPETYRELGRSMVAALLMFANVLFYRTAGYFSAPAEEKPLLHTWSLSVEDQFYLTWPLLLLLLAPRVPRPWLIAITLALLAASLSHAEAKLAVNPDYAFYLLAPRAWELLAGCVTALAAQRLSFARLTSSLLGASGLVLILASGFVLNSSKPFPGLAAAPAVLGTVLVIVAGLGNDGAQGPARVLAWRPVVVAGLLSYSLYLWHWPVISLAQFAASRPLTPGELAAAVGLSVLLAALSWRFVELRFRVHGPVSTRVALKTIATGAAVMAVLATTGGAIRAFDGVPSRFDGAVRKLFDEMANGNPLRPFCDGDDYAFKNNERCNFGRRKLPGESFEMAVLGDSNADHFVPLVADWAQESQLAGRQVTRSACAPLLGAALKVKRTWRKLECRPYHEAIVAFVESNPGLKLVVLSGVWPDYARHLGWNGLNAKGLVRPQGVDGALAFTEVLASTVRYFRARGIRVHLIGQVPHFKVLPARCTTAALAAGRDVAPCGRHAKDVRAELAETETALSALAASDPGVTVTLPTATLCGPDWCSPMKDGVFLYRNTSHLNSAGARHLARYFTLPPTRE